eukprot:CAMPEP_0204227830 /NCGR_PEP_ID=MMETSP0361-20130328/85992_1 /ASSEMBLY_ACC=CAM_ASM_000343 /TAXON_ID=268821 /ORGANISM="Scrippsiella Hangoei, Strain SHTV-5" /LENGTH=83 /DNA_ID=CAMNT_0051195483 /DNA_START=1 /DNA_END=248 /DNA_ORIENTATION=+
MKTDQRAPSEPVPYQNFSSAGVAPYVHAKLGGRTEGRPHGTHPLMRVPRRSLAPPLRLHASHNLQRERLASSRPLAWGTAAAG